MSQYPKSTSQPATTKPNSSKTGQSVGSAIYNKQPGTVAINPNHARNFVPTTTWICRADPIEGVTPGQEYLATIDAMIVNQVYEVPDVDASPMQCRNRFSVQNVNGEQIYYAAEMSKYWQRQCCGAHRGFTINIRDITKKKIMVLRRPFKCFALRCVSCLSGISCFSQEYTIESPPGTVIATVWQRPTCCFVEELHIQDETGKDIFTIQGPCECFLTPCSDDDYSIHRLDGSEVGMISKKFPGCCIDALSDTEAFRITFRMALDAKMKAILLGASFLIGATTLSESNS